MTYLVLGDPSAVAAHYLLEQGIPASDITVWEDTRKGQSELELTGVTVTSDLDTLMGLRFDVVIGNPPYGKNANLAIQFLNKASELSDDIRLVLPRTLRKPSAINRLNPHLHLVSDVTCPDNTFGGVISACVQCYEVREDVRPRIETLTRHEDFTFTDRDNCDICLGRVGGGPTGRVYDQWDNRSSNSHYFLSVSDPIVIERLRSLEDTFRTVAKETVGCMSLSKHDIVTTYTSQYG